MNKKRKNDIINICSKLRELYGQIRTIKDDEESYYDNMPENLQWSLRGMDSEESIDILEDAMSSIDSAISKMEEI